MEKILKARPGSYFYRAHEIPINSQIFTIKSGQECNLRGITSVGGVFFAKLFVFDTEKFVETPFWKIEKYL